MTMSLYFRLFLSNIFRKIHDSFPCVPCCSDNPIRNCLIQIFIYVCMCVCMTKFCYCNYFKSANNRAFICKRFYKRFGHSQKLNWKSCSLQEIKSCSEILVNNSFFQLGSKYFIRSKVFQQFQIRRPFSLIVFVLLRI